MFQFKFQQNDLVLMNRLRSGSFADVYRLQDKISNKYFAVKCFKENTDQADIDLECQIFDKML